MRASNLIYNCVPSKDLSALFIPGVQVLELGIKVRDRIRAIITGAGTQMARQEWLKLLLLGLFPVERGKPLDGD